MPDDARDYPAVLDEIQAAQYPDGQPEPPREVAPVPDPIDTATTPDDAAAARFDDPED